MGSRRMLLSLLLLPLFTACAPAGVELPADIATWPEPVWVREGGAYTLADLDGVPTWARLDDGEVVAVAPLPPGHREVTDVRPLGADDVVAVDASGAALALAGDEWTVLGATDEGEPPLTSVCGRDAGGDLWLLGLSTRRADELSPWVDEARLVRLRDGSFESHPLPIVATDCWVAEGEVWVRETGSSYVWQRAGAEWVEHAPWDDGVGLLAPTPRSIAGRTYIHAAEQLWSREGGEWIAHPISSALPDGRSFEYAHTFYASAPDDVVVAFNVYASTGCFYRWCGRKVDHVALYRWDGVEWYGLGAVPPPASDDVTRGLTHLWLDDDGAYAILGGRLYFGPL